MNGRRGGRRGAGDVHATRATIGPGRPLKERAMRIEIRVRPTGIDWEVDGYEMTFCAPTRAAALRHARDIARLAWVEERRCSTVKELRQEGWAVDAFYGLEGLYA
jgi:hypothetical protein